MKSVNAKKILFIVNDLYTNTFKTVHDLASESPFYVVKVVASKCMETAQSPLISAEEISALLSLQGIKHEVGITPAELIRYSPDWIFVSRPYNDYLEPHLVSSELSQYGKLGHLSYGSALIQWVNQYAALRNNPFLTDASAFFVSSELEFPGEPKFVPVGQLKLDEYIQGRRLIHSYRFPSIAWKPRWTVGEDSSLESHLDTFSKLAESGGTQVLFVMHPLLMRNLELTGQKLLKRKLLSFLDIRHVFTSQGPFFLDSVLGADVFFGDTSSTLAEYSFTKKPRIWNRPPIDHLNELGKSVLRGSHVSESVSEFEDTFHRLLETRARSANENTPPRGSELTSDSKEPSAASKVLRHILND
jgi:hypothetical protein